MRTAVGLLFQAQSPRGRTYLRSLRPALAHRARSGVVADSNAAAPWARVAVPPCWS
ncbi:hypothetical protein AB0K20_15185 [Micromonospora matsumotoense]|uniref:hypothetical protein n=1 Tax=Micromonospora matsumotoense TaxID=121616 RepID=UPI003430C5C9